MWKPGKRQVRRIALALLLPALMFRAAIPAGYMPVASSGHPVLVMCSGVDMAAARTEAPGKHDPDSTRPSPPCHFTASAAVAPHVDHAGAVVIDGAAPLATRDKVFNPDVPAIVRAQSARAPPVSPNA